MNNLIAKKVIAGIILIDNKVLIAQRGKKDSLYGKWEFPGGKMEHDETEKECLARELHEEFEIEVIVGDYFTSSFFTKNSTNYEMRAYFVTGYTGEIRLTEHLQIKWVNFEELSNYDMPEPDFPIVEKLKISKK